MSTDRLSADAVKKVSGAAWEPLRETFLQLSRTLLSVNTDTAGVLTTIYVKFQLTSASSSDVYAVVWLKNSKRIVVGLALPEGVESEHLGPAPAGMSYKGITKYVTINPGDSVPGDFSAWAASAYQYASTKSGG